MKKTILSVIAAGALAISLPVSANAIDLKDLLGGNGLGETVGNLIEGVFTKTNLEVSDFVGEWTADGSAVTFKSDNFLQKAGGVAAAAALEAKLDPYYKQYGLTGAVITINADETFSIMVKKMKLSGTIVKNDDGTFQFNFKVLGKMSLGSVTTYVQKSGNTLEIMFDATKLKSLVSTVANFTGNSLAQTFGKLLDSYDGLCVGFSTTKTGEAAASRSSQTTKSDPATSKESTSTTKSGQSTTKSGGTKSSQTTNSSKDSTTKSTKKSTSTAEEAKSKISEALRGIFNSEGK